MQQENPVGVNAGASTEVLQHFNRSVQLFTPRPRPIAGGDQVRLVAGCDKTRETCSGRYGNILNFRCEPHIPGNDTVFSYPVKG